MTLTARLAEWVDQNGDGLRALGTVTFKRGDIDLPKPSAQLVIVREPRFVEAVVWDSGEVELSYGTPDDPTDEHHDIDESAELDLLLEKLVGVLKT